MKKVIILVCAFLMFGCASTVKEDISRAKMQALPLSVVMLQPYLANSAGGVSIALNFVNTSEERLKYAYFEVIPYNAVGDIQHSEIGNKSQTTLEFTGPIEVSNEMLTGRWDNVWFNNSISCIEVSSLKVVTFSGKNIEIPKEKLHSAMSLKINKQCH
jgi:hypothetical protein